MLGWVRPGWWWLRHRGAGVRRVGASPRTHDLLLEPNTRDRRKTMKPNKASRCSASDPEMVLRTECLFVS